MKSCLPKLQLFLKGSLDLSITIWRKKVADAHTLARSQSVQQRRRRYTFTRSDSDSLTHLRPRQNCVGAAEVVRMLQNIQS